MRDEKKQTGGLSVYILGDWNCYLLRKSKQGRRGYNVPIISRCCLKNRMRCISPLSDIMVENFFND